MNPRFLIYLVVLMIIPLIAASANEVAATERATTAELPPALVALGLDRSRVLSQTEADSVRGEAWVLHLLLGNLSVFARGEGPLDLSIHLPHVAISLRLGK